MNLIKENWNKNDYENFINYLYSLQDLKYKNFHSKLLPNTNNLIGIKIPILKKIAKDISKGNYIEFLHLTKHTIYEETMIHGFIISNIKLQPDNIIDYINNFLPYINNWAICDSFCASLHIIKKNKEIFYKYIKRKIKNKNIWIKRFCFVILLDYYLEEKYLKEIFNMCDSYNTNDYYVEMAIAWLISIAYIKHKNITLEYLNNNKLNNFTYNKAIQKIIESTRIKKEEKEELKLLKK